MDFNFQIVFFYVLVLMFLYMGDYVLPRVHKKLKINKIKSETEEILDRISYAYVELKDAEQYFSCAREPELVDFATYRLKAAEIYYDYLLKIAREKGVKNEKT